MSSFLREYWAWIVVPMAVVLGGLALLLAFTAGDGGTSPFIYNVF